MSEQLAGDDLYPPPRHFSWCLSQLACERERTSSAAWQMALPTFSFSPYVMLTVAAAFLRTPNAWMSGSGIRSCSPPISKFWRDLSTVRLRHQYCDPA